MGNCLFLRARGWGIDRQVRKKWQIPGGVPGGGMVTGRIEPCISRRGRRPSWLNQGIFRKIEQDNCFIIQQIPIAYHSQNEKNYGSMIKTLKIATHKLNKNQNRTSRNRSYYRSLKKTYLQTHV